MPPPVRLAIAGCGRIARRVHLPALTAMRGVEVVALADTDTTALDAARRLAPRAVTLSRYEELPGRHGLDAVVVCLPSHLHADAARRVLDARIALYLEKPIAAGLDEARALVAAAAHAGRPAMIGFNYRFHPLIAELRQRVTRGALGTPREWRSTFSVPAHERPAWKLSVATGGGVLLDFASHHVDLIRFVTGQEVREVTTTTTSRGDSEEDSAEMTLVLDSGVVCHVACSWSGANEDRIRVEGSTGTLTFDRHRSLGLEHVNLRYGLERWLAPRREPSYHRAFSYFVDCVRSGAPASPSLEDGLRSLEVILAARASARDGRAVGVA